MSGFLQIVALTKFSLKPGVSGIKQLPGMNEIPFSIVKYLQNA